MYLPHALPISIQRAARCCHKLGSRVTRGELVYGARIFTSIYKLRYLLALLSTGARPDHDNLIFPGSIRRSLHRSSSVHAVSAWRIFNRLVPRGHALTG